MPTCVGNIHIPAHRSIRLTDAKAVEEIARYPEIDVKIIKADVETGIQLPVEQTQPEIDYSRFKINELRSVAASLGIKGFFTMTKARLIQVLEEKNGIPAS